MKTAPGKRLPRGGAAAALRARGLPVTLQRQAVWEELCRRLDHPTADAVFDAVAQKLSGISRPTVYRILEAFVDAGLACKVHHPGAASRFDARVDRHHHLVCSRCEKIEDWEETGFPALRLPNLKRSGFAIQDYSIHFTGLCRSCAAGKENKRKTKGSA